MRLLEGYSSVKNLLTGRFGLMLTGNVLTILINILTVKILTNKLSTADFGSYSLIISFSTLPQLVLYAPISSAIFPQLQNKNGGEDYVALQKDIFDLFLLVASCLSIAFVGIYLLSLIVPTASSDLIVVGFIATLFSTSLSFLGTLDTFSLATHHIKEYLALPLLNIFVKLLILCGLYSIQVSPERLVVIFIVVHLLLSVLEYHFLRHRKIITYRFRAKMYDIFTLNTPKKIEILTYASNFFLWGVFGWLQSFFDKWILNIYIDKNAVAIYTVYYQYGFFPFTVMSSVVSQYITPLYFKNIYEDEKRRFMKRLLKFSVVSLLAILVVAGSLSYFLAPYFIGLLTNEAYLKYINLFPLIVFAGCFYGLGQIITVPLLDSDLVKKVRFPKIFTAVVSVMLFWTLISIMGFSGILTALIMSNVLYYGLLFLISHKHCWSDKLNKVK